MGEGKKKTYTEEMSCKGDRRGKRNNEGGRDGGRARGPEEDEM